MLLRRAGDLSWAGLKAQQASPSKGCHADLLSRSSASGFQDRDSARCHSQDFVAKSRTKEGSRRGGPKTNVRMLSPSSAPTYPARATMGRPKEEARSSQLAFSAARYTVQVSPSPRVPPTCPRLLPSLAFSLLLFNPVTAAARQGPILQPQPPSTERLIRHGGLQSGRATATPTGARLTRPPPPAPSLPLPRPYS